MTYWPQTTNTFGAPSGYPPNTGYPQTNYVAQPTYTNPGYASNPGYPPTTNYPNTYPATGFTSTNPSVGSYTTAPTGYPPTTGYSSNPAGYPASTGTYPQTAYTSTNPHSPSPPYHQNSTYPANNSYNAPAGYPPAATPAYPNTAPTNYPPASYDPQQYTSTNPPASTGYTNPAPAGYPPTGNPMPQQYTSTNPPAGTGTNGYEWPGTAAVGYIPTGPSTGPVVNPSLPSLNLPPPPNAVSAAQFPNNFGNYQQQAQQADYQEQLRAEQAKLEQAKQAEQQALEQRLREEFAREHAAKEAFEKQEKERIAREEHAMRESQERDRQAREAQEKRLREEHAKVQEEMRVQQEREQKQRDDQQREQMAREQAAREAEIRQRQNNLQALERQEQELIQRELQLKEQKLAREVEQAKLDAERAASAAGAGVGGAPASPPGVTLTPAEPSTSPERRGSQTARDRAAALEIALAQKKKMNANEGLDLPHRPQPSAPADFTKLAPPTTQKLTLENLEADQTMVNELNTNGASSHRDSGGARPRGATVLGTSDGIRKAVPPSVNPDTRKRGETVSAAGGKDKKGKKDKDDDDKEGDAAKRAKLYLTWHELSKFDLIKWSKANGYYKKKIENSSKEFTKFMDFFNTTMGATGALEIEELTAVYNQDLISNFNNSAKTLKKRHQDSADIFLKTTWEKKPDVDHRRWVIDQYQKRVDSFGWNKDLKDDLPIIPVLHGTSFAVAEKILQTGFAMTATLDSGYYGQGIYFSSNAMYILPYFSTKKDPCILLCYAIPGNPYPVGSTEGRKSADTLMGTALQAGYQSHYVVTNRSGELADKTENGTNCYDELVIIQEAQVIPAYIIRLVPTGLTKLAKKWSQGGGEGPVSSPSKDPGTPRTDPSKSAGSSGSKRDKKTVIKPAGDSDDKDKDKDNKTDKDKMKKSSKGEKTDADQRKTLSRKKSTMLTEDIKAEFMNQDC